jgi:gliding motility-associated lipoprotein GldH
LTGCRHKDPDGIYYPFKTHAWQRFNILKFELPVKRSEKPYTLVFFARHNEEYPYKSLDFSMIMNTPSGEERIREFQLMIRDADDKFLGTCEMEICEATIVLKKELYINKEGVLLIELENLIPRMETPGLLGVGIRMKQN